MVSQVPINPLNLSMKGASFITIILILTVLGVFFFSVAKIVSPMDYYYKYQDDKRKTDLLTIQKALETYYKDNNQYPISTGNGTRSCIGDNLIKYRNPNTKEVEPVQWGTKWFGYLEPLPKDPGSTCYVYFVSPTRQSYWLYTSLDLGAKDEHACGQPGITCNNMVAHSLLTACHPQGASEKDNCNYGVSSANESL
ncbi:N/A [soil metagenome]